jgi:hypothetical protein
MEVIGMRRLTAVLVLLFALSGATPGSAARLTRGKSVIWAGLNGNRAQLMSPIFETTSAFERGEFGLHLAYSYFLTDAWSVIASGGFDVGSLQLKPPATLGPTRRVSSNSWNLRVGFDRYAFIDDNVALYAGPGLLYWRGNAEGDGFGDEFLDQDWPTVRQIGFNGRLGMYARFASHYALFGQIGQVIGANSTENGNGRITWWTSHHEGTVGLAVDL